METRILQQVIAWARGTDLVELCWRKGDDGLEFRLEAASPSAAAFPVSTLVPVASPGVGLFRWAAPGAPRRAQEGGSVAAGDTLGVLETGGAPVDVKAPAGGRLLKILVDEGKAVEYGQPLFLISPT